ncbi:DUF3572 domain-containing protein [Enterovirga rhinocerotis]|uniref:Uncharacterized protein DUF3572 n=1 Tax=Enterovirga rhinocerotis TaxID=1339210 RepID=A0A4R7C7T9_9HYPH|nr:DUF3572 domain-containing protein [Enterovirga rhinocerotis]TDR94391.1 uncharacterized protein DUF3572 [Enterovirga rhinocerotis]
MKGESTFRNRRPLRLSVESAEALALDSLQCLAADGERLGRFLSLSGLDPTTIRTASADPGFLPAVLDYIAADEELLLALARETGHAPERFVEARRILSPEPDWGA